MLVYPLTHLRKKVNQINNNNQNFKKMKKQIFTIAILFLSFITNAQEKDAKRFQFGARSGVNISTIAGEDKDFDNPDAIVGFYTGLVVEAKLSDRFSLLGEVFYSRQGFEFGESEDKDDFDPQFQVDYIQVPVLFKVNIFKGISAHAGPQFGFKVNEEYDTDIFGSGGDTDTDYFEDFDFQVVTGAQYTFDFGLFVQARYTLGLSEVVKNSEAHNAVVSAGVGFMF